MFLYSIVSELSHVCSHHQSYFSFADACCVRERPERETSFQNPSLLTPSFSSTLADFQLLLFED